MRHGQKEGSMAIITYGGCAVKNQAIDLAADFYRTRSIRQLVSGAINTAAYLNLVESKYVQTFNKTLSVCLDCITAEEGE